jgi:glycosyltransferase involved in cell wall biosynthesis
VNYSLVVTTVGRQLEFKRLLESLQMQPYGQFELIVIDQSSNLSIENVCKEYSKRFPVVHINTPRIGLSKARNMGIAKASGDIIAFPDDDCWYDEKTLVNVNSIFESAVEKNIRLDGVSVMTVNSQMMASCARWEKAKGVVTMGNVWNTAISVGLFLKSDLIAEVGPFDESLGVGSLGFVRSGEETDFVMRALNLGANIAYEPDFFVFHEDNFAYNAGDSEKAFSYGYGMGYVMKKNRYPFRLFFKFFLRSIGGLIVNMAMGRSKRAFYYLYIAKGRLRGYTAFEK